MNDRISGVPRANSLPPGVGGGQSTGNIIRRLQTSVGLSRTHNVEQKQQGSQGIKSSKTFIHVNPNTSDTRKGSCFQFCGFTTTWLKPKEQPATPETDPNTGEANPKNEAQDDVGAEQPAAPGEMYKRGKAQTFQSLISEQLKSDESSQEEAPGPKDTDPNAALVTTPEPKVNGAVEQPAAQETNPVQRQPENLEPVVKTSEPDTQGEEQTAETSNTIKTTICDLWKLLCCCNESTVTNANDVDITEDHQKIQNSYVSDAKVGDLIPVADGEENPDLEDLVNRSESSQENTTVDREETETLQQSHVSGEQTIDQVKTASQHTPQSIEEGVIDINDRRSETV